MKILSDERGQAAVLMLLSMSLMLGFVGLAVDVGGLFRAKREMQTAADAGAIAGALELNYGDVTAGARAATAQNGVTYGVTGTVVAVNNPPLNGPHTGNAAYVEVIVSQSQPTIFMSMLNLAGANYSSMNVTARAVATLGPSQGCIYTLGTSGPDIDITGNADISVPTCGIVDDSSSSDALDLTGNITLTAQSIGIVGGYSDTGNISLTPANPVKGIAPAPDPLAFLPTPSFTPSSCLADPGLVGNNSTSIGQGCYKGLTFTGNQVLNLSAGTYVIDGNIDITGNAKVTGTGVTLYVLGSVTLTGNVSLDLTAPTSGDYDGILFDQPQTDRDAVTITGNSGSTLEGIVYAPGAAVNFTGNSSSKIYTDFVVGSLTLTGNSSFEDYAAINGAGPLTSATLVE